LGYSDEGFGGLEKGVGVLPLKLVHVVEDILILGKRRWEMGRERTGSSKEKGRQDLNVAFESIESINVAQLLVILLLNPVSKGVGKLAALVAVATAMLLLDVLVVASVVDTLNELELVEVERFVCEDEEEDEWSPLRRRRSAGSSVGLSNAQFCGSGGGR
jgi:hypothetical protein